MGPVKPGNSVEDKTPFTGRCPWKQEPFIYGSQHTGMERNATNHPVISSSEEVRRNMKEINVWERVYDKRQLLEAWQQVKKNDGIAGVDNMNVKDFKERRKSKENRHPHSHGQNRCTEYEYGIGTDIQVKSLAAQTLASEKGEAKSRRSNTYEN